MCLHPKTCTLGAEYFAVFSSVACFRAFPILSASCLVRVCCSVFPISCLVSDLIYNLVSDSIVSLWAFYRSSTLTWPRNSLFLRYWRFLEFLLAIPSLTFAYCLIPNWCPISDRSFGISLRQEALECLRWAGAFVSFNYSLFLSCQRAPFGYCHTIRIEHHLSINEINENA